MSQFWGQFISIESAVFRIDTRIYLSDVKSPTSQDYCIGAIVGKNPGSANPNDTQSLDLQEIKLNGDKLLGTVRNIVQKAYIKADKEIPKYGYVQVLNLFYLCNKDLNQAIRRIKLINYPEYCKSENTIFDWIWYLWGCDNKSLNEFKKRFTAKIANNHFFYDNKCKTVVNSMPGIFDSVRHIQGMQQDKIINFISGILV